MAEDFDSLLALLKRTTDPGWLDPLLDDAASGALVGGVVSIFARLGPAVIHNRDAALISAASAGQLGSCTLVVSRAAAGSMGVIPKGYPFIDDRGLVLVSQTPVPVPGGALSVNVPCQTIRMTEEANTVDPPIVAIHPTDATEVFDAGGTVYLIARPVDPSTGLPFPASGPTTLSVVTAATPITGSSADWLSVHARERGLIRQPNEQEADLRARVRNIPDAVSPIAVADVVQAVAQQQGLPPFLVLEPFNDGASADLKDLHGLGFFESLGFDVDFWDDPAVARFVLDRRQTTAYFAVQAQDYVRDPLDQVLYWDDGFWDDDALGYPDAALAFPPIATASLLALLQSVQAKKAGGVSFDLMLFEGTKIYGVGSAISTGLSVAWVLAPPPGKAWLIQEIEVDHDQPTTGTNPPIPVNAHVVAHNLNFTFLDGSSIVTTPFFESFTELYPPPTLLVTRIRGLVQGNGVDPVNLFGYFRVVELAL